MFSRAHAARSVTLPLHGLSDQSLEGRLLGERLKFVTALIGGVTEIGPLARRTKLWSVTYIRPITADSGIFSGARRQCECSAETLCVRWVLPIADNLAGDLISRRISSNTVATVLSHPARDVNQAKTVPRHAVTESVAYACAIFIKGGQEPLFPDRGGLERAESRIRKVNLPFLRQITRVCCDPEGQGSAHREGGQRACAR